MDELHRQARQDGQPSAHVVPLWVVLARLSGMVHHVVQGVRICRLGHLSTARRGCQHMTQRAPEQTIFLALSQQCSRLQRRSGEH